MHTNPVFRGAPDGLSLDFARSRGFGTLSANGDPVPMLSHIPFLLGNDGQTADLHLTRPNPIARACTDTLSAMISVVGPDGYVSPDWYGVPDQVPTWNYVAVHLVGRLHRRPDTDLPALLGRMSDAFEARLLPKPIWKMAKVDPQVLSRFYRMIVPFRFEVTEIRSTWKLSQNKPEPARIAAANAMETGTGQDLAALAAWMRQPPVGE